jgi:hypothetical protein
MTWGLLLVIGGPFKKDTNCKILKQSGKVNKTQISARVMFNNEEPGF